MMKQFHPLTDLQWQVLEPLFPLPEKRGRGKPHTPWRNVVNTILFVHSTNSKWANAPTGLEWASKSAAHRWMDIWKKNGLLEQILSLMESMVQMASEIHFEQNRPSQTSFANQI
jgi:transposase